MQSMIADGIIASDDVRISLTPKGRAWLAESRIILYSSGDRPWRDCPEKFRQPQHGPFQPILPTIPLLHKSFFATTGISNVSSRNSIVPDHNNKGGE